MMKKISSVVYEIFFVATIVLCLLFVIGYSCGLRGYVTMSGSMEPTIQTGSLCVVNTRENYETIKEGDVIVFQALSSIVTHRAIAITEEGIETKGDNNEVTDGITTTSENFKGKTLFSIPYVGYMICLIQNPYVLTIIIGVMVAIILLTIINYAYKDEKTNTILQDTK